MVVAVYNDEALLPDSGMRLARALDRSDLDWELIFVDDHSQDRSAQACEDIVRAFPGRVHLIRLPRNRGQQKALFCGLEAASKTWLLTFDLDSASAVDKLEDILATVPARRADLVNICRSGQKRHGFTRAFGAAFFRGLANRATKRPMTDPLSSLKLIHRDLFNKGLHYPEKLRFLAPLAIQLAENPVEISVSLPKRRGRSSFDLAALVHLALDFIIAFFPLLFVRLLIASLAVTALSGVSGVLYLALRLLGVIPPSVHFQVICLVLFGLSLQGILFALLGEYQVRTHDLLHQTETNKHVEMEKHQ